MNGGLHKKRIIDKNGKRTSVWVSANKPKGDGSRESEQTLKKESIAINKKVDRLSNILQKYPSTASGVSDEVRSTDKYRKDKKAFDQAFRELQDFNSKLPKAISRKWHKEKRAKWRKA